MRKRQGSQVREIQGAVGPSWSDDGAFRFANVDAQSVDFSERRFSAWSAERTVFEDCSFDGATFDYAQMGGHDTIYRGCTFRGADLRGIDPADARFEECIFDDAKIAKWMSYCAEFVGCRFATRLVDCVFSATPRNCLSGRARNEFMRNDFRNAELLDTVFVGGISLDDQLLPAAPDYVRIPADRLPMARVEIEAWRDDGRDDAPVELALLERFAEDQNELLVRRGDLAVSDRFWFALGVNGEEA